MKSSRPNPETLMNNTQPRTVQALLASLFLVFAIGAAITGCSPSSEDKATALAVTDQVTNTDASVTASSLADRLDYARAFEAIIWATPFLNTLQMRSELERLGISDGKLAFVGSPPASKLILPTYNRTTVYVFGGFSLKDGPVVMEIPAVSDKAKLFGTVENVWDDPLVDIGPAGSDKGKGGVYVFPVALPPHKKSIEVFVCVYADMLPVVESCTSHRCIINGKA